MHLQGSLVGSSKARASRCSRQHQPDPQSLIRRTSPRAAPAPPFSAVLNRALLMRWLIWDSSETSHDYSGPASVTGGVHAFSQSTDPPPAASPGRQHACPLLFDERQVRAGICRTGRAVETAFPPLGPPRQPSHPRLTQPRALEAWTRLVGAGRDWPSEHFYLGHSGGLGGRQAPAAG